MGFRYRRITVTVNIYGGDTKWDWETYMEIHPNVVRIHQHRGDFNELVTLDRDAIQILIEKYSSLTT